MAEEGSNSDGDQAATKHDLDTWGGQLAGQIGHLKKTMNSIEGHDG
jgi:hypothetical protein